MKSSRLYILLLSCFLSVFFHAGLYAQSGALNTFVKSANLKYAGIGIKVIDMETGKTVCSYNENLALTPASVLKSLTTASALELFGPEYTFQTRICSNGKIDNQGILQGNLLIIGSGDPSLGSGYFENEARDFLPEWLSAIKKAGIKSITGNVITVDDLYGYEGVSPRWIWQDLGNYYAPGTYGISIFDNAYQLTLKSGAPGTKPQIIDTNPFMKHLQFDNNLTAAANTSDSVYIYGMPFSDERRLYGTMPARKSSFTVKGNLPDPGLMLSETLVDYLRENDISIKGKAITSRTDSVGKNQTIQLIYKHTGKSLREIIKVTNFRSNNHFAEHLFYKIGWDGENPASSFVPGLSASRIAALWKKNGIDTDGMCMYDGCGLAVGNAVPAGLFTDMLVYMQKKSKYATIYYQSLPLAGKEGTVRSFLKGSALEGKARIKSGSIANVQSYAGYLEKGSKKYAFTVIVNNFTGSRSKLRSQIEQFLIGIN